MVVLFYDVKLEKLKFSFEKILINQTLLDDEILETGFLLKTDLSQPKNFLAFAQFVVNKKVISFSFIILSLVLAI